MDLGKPTKEIDTKTKMLVLLKSCFWSKVFIKSFYDQELLTASKMLITTNDVM